MTETDGSERQLILSAVAGDLSAFDDLVTRHWLGAFKVAMSFLRDADEAEDVAQDAFLKAFERVHALGPPYAFGPWIRQIATNIARNRCMRRSPTLPLDSTEGTAAESSLSEASNEIEAAERVSRALAVLSRQSPVLRETARLRYLCGHSNKEIERRLHAPEGTIKRRLWDARAKIRKEMSMTASSGNDFGPFTTVPAIQIDELPGASMRVPVRGYGLYFGSVLEVGNVEVCKFFDYPGGILTQTVRSEVRRKVNLFGRECFEVLIKHSDCEPAEPNLLEYFEVREDGIAWVLELLADDVYAKVRNQVSTEPMAPLSYCTSADGTDAACRVVRLKVGEVDRGQCLAVIEDAQRDGTPAERFYSAGGRVVLHRRYVRKDAPDSPYYDFNKLPEEPNLMLSGKAYRLWYDCVLVDP